MKLVLGSAPEGKKIITEKIVELAGKPAKEISVVVINEASAVEPVDMRWLINGLNVISQTFGGAIYFCNLLSLNIKDVEKRINKADVIWCFGGNSDYLKLIFEKTGFDKLLPKLLKTKVWVGSSAGSCVMGERGSYKGDVLIYKEDKWYDIKCYMGLIKGIIYPHMGGPFVPPNAYDICAEESKSQPYPVYALSDNSAVIVDNDKVYMIGKNSQKLINGKVIESV